MSSQPWLETGYAVRLEDIRKYVCNLWEKGQSPIWFTPHGAEHARQVEETLGRLLPKAKRQLNQREAFCLLAAAWLHDVGMLEDLSQEEGLPSGREPVRLAHHAASRQYVIDRAGELQLELNEPMVIGWLCFYHSRSADIAQCPDEQQIGSDRVRTQLLASYLRLGDALSVDQRRVLEGSDARFLYKTYVATGIMSPTARLHWLKSLALSGVHIDPDAHRIQLEFRKPERWTDEQMNPLVELVRGDVEDELASVKDILIMGNLTTFAHITSQLFTDGFSPEEISELEKIVREMLLLHSPNASRLIDALLDGVIAVSEVGDQRTIENYMKELSAITRERSCHIALCRILEDLKRILREIVDYEQGRRRLVEYCESTKRERQKKLEILRKHVQPFLQDKGAILLFGYSQSVISAISALPEAAKHILRIYVGECRTKTRYERGQLRYCDGAAYAIDLHREGIRNISIVPDAAIANLFQRSMISKVLIGANGIDSETGRCGHTAGHSIITHLARAYDVPVYVVADSMKFGRLEEHLDKQRDTTWLTGQTSFLSKLPSVVCLENPREDIIPASHVTLFITDIGVFPPAQLPAVR